MYCRYCGAELDDDAVFCEKCGKQLRKLRPETNSRSNDKPPAVPFVGVHEVSGFDDAGNDEAELKDLVCKGISEGKKAQGESEESTPSAKENSRCENDGKRNEEPQHEQAVTEALQDGDAKEESGRAEGWPVIKPSLQHRVLKGEFKNAKVGCGENGLYLVEWDECRGLTLNRDTVAGFNSVSNLSENLDGTRDVAVRWKYGEMSLLLLDGRLFSVLEESCDRCPDLKREDVKERLCDQIANGLYVVAAFALIPLIIGAYGIFPYILIAAFLALFPWIICFAFANVLGEIVKWYCRLQLDKRYFTEEERRAREQERITAERRNEAAKRERESAERARAAEAKKREEQKRKLEIAKNLKCPICGSRDIERIGTGSRIASVAMVGLASGKAGKQYKCKYCKHMW